MEIGLMWQVTLSVAVCAIAVFVRKMLKVRLLFHNLKKQGLPMPRWNFVTGHLGNLPALLEKLPRGSQQSDARHAVGGPVPTSAQPKHRGVAGLLDARGHSTHLAYTAHAAGQVPRGR